MKQNKGKNFYSDHPGIFIKMELEARGWSQRDLAFVLGQTEQQLNPLLSGKRAITPDVARLLGDAFSVDAAFFANLQSQHDLSKSKDPDPAVSARAELQSFYPVREMVRRGWIKDGEASLLQLQMSRFFEANDNAVAKIRFAAKRTSYEDTPSNQLAWVFRVRQLARSVDVKELAIEKLRASLPKLRGLMIDPEAVKEVPGILADCGVRFVVVEALPGAKIDGVCTWLDDKKPVIGISNLYDRIDNFWFVVRHEIEHVLEGHGKVGIGMIDYLAGENSSEISGVAEEEIIANHAASDFCVPRDRMESFYVRKAPFFSERDVLGFAATLSVHPALVVGQLQRRLKRYDFLRKYQVSVRDFILQAALFDGWGSVAQAEL